MEYAKAHGTWLLAPNGEPSNHTPQQWTFVRSRAFKRWFGCWDVAGNDVAIVEAEPIRENNKDAGLALANRLGLIRLMSNEDTGGKGKINISKASIKKMLTMDEDEAKAVSAVKYAALPHLHEIIKLSVFAETHPDYKKGANGERSPENGINPDLDIDILYGALRFNGRMYRVKTTLKRYADKNKDTKAYTYDVTEIEVLPGTLDSAETTRSPQRKPSISTDILLKDVKNVNGNLTLDDFSKVLDENGEPLVVRCSVRGNDAKEITHMSIKTMWVKKPAKGTSPYYVQRNKPAGGSQKLTGDPNVM